MKNPLNFNNFKNNCTMSDFFFLVVYERKQFLYSVSFLKFIYLFIFSRMLFPIRIVHGTPIHKSYKKPAALREWEGGRKKGSGVEGAEVVAVEGRGVEAPRVTVPLALITEHYLLIPR